SLMKSPFAMMALAGTLVAPIALAQVPPPARSPQGAGTRASATTSAAPMSSAAGGTIRPLNNIPALTPSGSAPPSTASAKKDPRVFEASTALPSPTLPDQMPAPTIALPNDPIEPFLLTRQAGPFMVMARTFKGPDAERWALALVLELRNEHHLPAYIMRTRDYPMRSNMRDLPPTADRGLLAPQVAEPEKSRTHDEAVVLVGDEKTVEGAAALLKSVKKIKPKC